MTKKTVVAAFMALVLMWAGNLIYFQKQQLPQPLFLKHYYDLNAGGDSLLELQLYYLVNKSRDLELTGLEIPGKDIRLQVDKGAASTFTHYYLNSAIIRINGRELAKLLSSGDAAITNLVASFSDGSRQEVKIGEIHLAGDRIAANSPLQVRANGSSNQNKGFALFYADALLVVKRLDYRFQDRLGDTLRVYLDRSEAQMTELGRLNDSKTHSDAQAQQDALDSLSTPAGQEVTKETFPFTAQAGEAFRLSYAFAFDNSNQSMANDYYRIEGKITGESDGQSFAQRYFIHYDPYFNEAAIRKMIRERREK